MPVASFSKKADLGMAGPSPAAKGKLSAPASLKGLLAGKPSNPQKVKSGISGEGIMGPTASSNDATPYSLPGDVLKKGRL